MPVVLLWATCGPKENAISPLVGVAVSGGGGGRRRSVVSAAISSVFADPLRSSAATSSEERVYEVVLKQAALVKTKRKSDKRGVVERDERSRGILINEGDFSNGDLLSAAYDRCGEVCAEYAKTFYLGMCTLRFLIYLLPPLSPSPLSHFLFFLLGLIFSLIFVDFNENFSPFFKVRAWSKKEFLLRFVLWWCDCEDSIKNYWNCVR